MEIQCEAFGDEAVSPDGRFAIFSFFAVETRQIATAVEILNRAKRRFGVPESARFHCRVIFSGMQRAKTEWRTLKPQQPIEICRYLGTELLLLKPIWIYSYVDMSEVKKQPKPNMLQGKFANAGAAPSKEFSMPFSEKQAQRFAYTGASFPLHQQFPTANIWVDRDSTQVEWFDKRRGQAHNLNPIVPSSSDLPTEYLPMLEIADLFAYSTGRYLAKDQRPGWPVFRSIHRRFKPTGSRFQFDPSLFGGEPQFWDGSQMQRAEEAGPSEVASLVLPHAT